MLWTPARVAGFAQAAGFRGAPLVDAIAVALATSGGDDAWHLEVGIGPVVDQRGLWGLDVAAWPTYADQNLWRPSVAATAARALYRACGLSWGWAPAWRAGIAPAILTAAATAARQPSDSQPLPANPNPAAAGSPYAIASARADALRSALAQPIQWG